MAKEDFIETAIRQVMERFKDKDGSYTEFFVYDDESTEDDEEMCLSMESELDIFLQGMKVNHKITVVPIANECAYDVSMLTVAYEDNHHEIKIINELLYNY